MYKARKIKIIIESNDFALKWLPSISIKFIRNISRFILKAAQAKFKNSENKEDKLKLELLSHITNDELNIISNELM